MDTIKEPAKINFLLEQVQPGDFFVDAGACEGYFTFPIAKLVEHGQVLAFEPNEVNYLRLVSEVTRLKLENVHVSNCALSNHTGHGDLYIGMAKYLHSLKPNLMGRLEAAQRVTLARLDGYMGAAYDKWRVDGLKIDVEGAEIEVLQGAVKTLESVRYLAMDVHPTLGVDVDEVAKLITASGLTIVTRPWHQNEIFAVREDE